MTRRRRKRAFKAPIRAAVRGSGQPLLLDGPAVGRRGHRPGRHQNRCWGWHFRSSATRRSSRSPTASSGCECDGRLSTPFWSPTAARSRSGSSARCGGWASGRSPSTATPTPARATSPRPTSRCGIGPAPARRELPQHRRGRRRRGAHRSAGRAPRATDSSRRTPNSPRRCERAGIVFIGPPVARHPDDGRQDRRQERGVARSACRWCPASRGPG